MFILAKSNNDILIDLLSCYSELNVDNPYYQNRHTFGD